MNYNKHLEELNKFREEINKIADATAGIEIELGNYIAEVERMRDDAPRGKKLGPEDFPRDGGMSDSKDEYYITDKNGDRIIEQEVQSRYKKLAGLITDG